MNHVLVFLIIAIFHFHNPPEYIVTVAPQGTTLEECQGVAVKTKAALLARPDPTGERKDVAAVCSVLTEGSAD